MKIDYVKPKIITDIKQIDGLIPALAGVVGTLVGVGIAKKVLGDKLNMESELIPKLSPIIYYSD
jgi:hypothetical protein